MRLLARRILFYAITALAAVTVDFMIPRVMPGNPVEALLLAHAGPGSCRAERSTRSKRSTGSTPSWACGVSTCTTGSVAAWQPGHLVQLLTRPRSPA